MPFLNKKVKSGPTEAKLNITSMMDMFTIILVFILVNVRSQDDSIKLANEIELPPSSSQQTFKKAINIAMTRSSLSIENKEILKLKDGVIPTRALDGEKVVPLYTALDKLRPLVAKRKADKASEDATVILFQADRRIAYRTINQVMRTAGMAGYPNFRFAVMKKE